MRPSLPTGLALLVALLLAGGAFVTAARHGAHPRALDAAAPEPANTVVVELFTSEGCSSCPPADRLLALLDQTQPVPGAQIIALEQHVDYWDDLGWMDPFSSALFSERQQDYIHALHASTAYTPEMVVDGAAEFVGVDGRAIVAAILKSSRLPKAAVVIRRANGRKPGDAQVVPLNVAVASIPGWGAHDAAEVVFAVTEDNLSSNVTRGENSGSQLNHRAVVREMRTLGRVGVNGSFGAPLEEKLSPKWKLENLHAVVFLQARGSRRILGAAEIPLAPTAN